MCRQASQHLQTSFTLFYLNFVEFGCNSQSSRLFCVDIRYHVGCLKPYRGSLGYLLLNCLFPDYDFDGCNESGDHLENIICFLLVLWSPAVFINRCLKSIEPFHLFLVFIIRGSHFISKHLQFCRLCVVPRGWSWCNPFHWSNPIY